MVSDELLTVKLRYKEPDGDVSSKVEFPLTDAGTELAETSDDFRFAAAVASFGMVLRNSQYRGDSTFDTVIELANGGRGEDEHAYRSEFVQLVKMAKALKGTGD